MIEIKNLKVKFNDETIFENAEANFNSKVTIIKGPNGSGKTTLLNSIYGLNEYEGEIIIDGKKYSDETIYKVRNKKIKYITQHAKLIPDLKAIDNIKLLNSDINEDKIYQYADKLNLKDKTLKRKFKKCSGGEKQKILLINSLLSNSKYLFMDEIDNNLDKETIKALLVILKEEKRNLIVISHNLSTKIKETFNDDELSVFEIKDKKLVEIKNSLESEYEADENYKAIEIEKRILKKLLRLNTIPKVVISMIMGVILYFFITLVFAIVSTILFGFADPIDYFDSNITILNPPIKNEMVNEFGYEDWFNVTPYYFTEENKVALEALPYVDKVIPIHSQNNEINTEAYPYNDIQYYLKNGNFTISASELTKLNIENPSEFEEYEVETKFQTLLYPNEVNEQIGHNETEYIYGSAPTDNSNEVAVSLAVALQIALENNYSSVEDVIGKTYNVQLTSSANSQNLVKDGASPQSTDVITENLMNVEFTVAGITKEKNITDNKISALVTLPYSETSEIVLRNEPWLNNDYDSIYSAVNIAYESVGFTIPENVGPNDVGKYESFYVVLNDEAKAKDIFEDVYAYDPYIKVTNWYATQNTKYYQYMSHKMNGLYFETLILIILMLVIMILAVRYYKKEFNTIKQTLEFYGFSSKDIKSIINKDINNIFMWSILVSIIVIYLKMILISSDDIGILLQCIVMAAVVNIIYLILLKRGN